MEAVRMAQDVSASDLDWKIAYDMQRCTLCGSCLAACTFGAIEAGVLRLDQAEGSKPRAVIITREEFAQLFGKN